MDKKYARQLSLALDGSGETNKELGRRLAMSASAIGKYSLGERRADHQKKTLLAKALKGLRLRLSSARSDFGTISFADNPRVRHDVFGATTAANREERERQQIWSEFQDAITVPAGKLTKAQSELVDRGFKEFAEEIGAELTEFIELAQYAERDPQQYIDDFNERLGG